MSLDIVTLRIGELASAVDIPVYREVITAVSPYLNGAFNGDFKEASDRTITLIDVNEQTVRIFLQWAHARLHTSDSDVSVPDPSILATGSLVAIPRPRSNKSEIWPRER